MFTEAGHTVDSLDIVKKSVESKSAVILDVREQAEWDAGHLADAQFIPLSKLKEAANVADVLAPLPKDLPIYVHCRSGGRVLMFAELAQGKGYDIRPLKAGYDRLVEAGFTKAQ
jgi:rhodanese-related sulfurtransferase